MSRSIYGKLLVALAGFALSSCDGVEMTNLYQGQARYCAEPERLAELVESCRERYERDGSCAGVFVARGIYAFEYNDDDPGFTEEGRDLHSFMFTSDLERFNLMDAQLPDARVVRDRIEMVGASPYFNFVLGLRSVGGDIDHGDEERALELGGSQAYEPGWSTDALARAEFRVSAPPSSSDLPLATGNLKITLQTEDEMAGTFEFDRPTPYRTVLRGCFHGFGTSRTLSQVEFE